MAGRAASKAVAEPGKPWQRFRLFVLLDTPSASLSPKSIDYENAVTMTAHESMMIDKQ